MVTMVFFYCRAWWSLHCEGSLGGRLRYAVGRPLGRRTGLGAAAVVLVALGLALAASANASSAQRKPVDRMPQKSEHTALRALQRYFSARVSGLALARQNEKRRLLPRSAPSARTRSRRYRRCLPTTSMRAQSSHSVRNSRRTGSLSLKTLAPSRSLISRPWSLRSAGRALGTPIRSGSRWTASFGSSAWHRGTPVLTLRRSHPNPDTRHRR